MISMNARSVGALQLGSTGGGVEPPVTLIERVATTPVGNVLFETVSFTV